MLEDGEKIHIPTKEEIKQRNSETTEKSIDKTTIYVTKNTGGTEKSASNTEKNTGNTNNSGNTKKYLINDNEVTEKEYNKVVNSYKRDNDRYRTYSYNGAEYSGYEDVSHALSALETKIQQIEQAEAEK